VRRALETALALYAELVEPRAVAEEVDRGELGEVYAAGRPDPAPTPLAEVVTRSEGLALFAATAGEPVSDEIRALFRTGELALAWVLDAVASAGADRLSGLLARRFERQLAERGQGGLRALPYSPGYCGWPVEGQRALFARLRPEEVGVRLNESCLMRPLKSVSGVLVAARPESHRFRPDFPFCEDCLRHQCRTRIASVVR
jgi:hypothetical protein